MKNPVPLTLEDLPEWARVEATMRLHSIGECPRCLETPALGVCPVWAAQYLMTRRSSPLFRTEVSGLD